jgi:hypothetical protein
MGMPLGWTILSMLHIFIVREALLRSGCWHLQKLVFIRILGDDLLAFWPKQANRAYSDLLSGFGLPISKGKHVVSAGRAIFARNLYMPIFKERQMVVNDY